MSNDNLEALRRMFGAVDAENTEPVGELLHPDVELIVHGSDPHAGSYTGTEGVRGFFDSWADAWETWEFEAKRFEAVGDDRVAVEMYQRSRGKGSGVEVENAPGHLWTFRDGRAVRWEIFHTFEQAVEAGRAAS